jgi:hypothetical protein
MTEDKSEQCKYPLHRTRPDISICVLEKGHEGMHYTYGDKNIYYTDARW